MWIDKNYYTSHIQDPTKIVKIRRVLDKLEIVLNNYIVETTDFLDPYEISLSKSILNRFVDIDYLVLGGFHEAERKILVIYPDFLNLEDISVGITAIKITGDLDKLSHKDFLGAILNLGIDRSKVGDILVHGNYGYIIVKEEVNNFILYNLEKIGNQNVKVKNTPLEEVESPEIKYKELIRFISSLRLDSVISAAYNLSRKESMNLIKMGKVKVNWETIDKASRLIEQGDIISVRGFGRLSLYRIDGISKKGRLKCEIRIFK
ncbi:RNA-binding protein [Wansuia hejianensis]|uniref:RNA-binding protein n=1 Tax=Wansuia hejianensis TaxID=2763667 RepID=A0A926EWW2_9FIRM|nr:YlmH/Sll1252 family protein [Wansuia hejianensis]MBC8590441.1 RNA-binding protein [Wansuia hejianensis]